MFNNTTSTLHTYTYTATYIAMYIPGSIVEVDLSDSVIILIILLLFILILLLLTAVTSTVYTPVVRLGTVMGLSPTMVVGGEQVQLLLDIVTLILLNVSSNSHDTLIVLADGEVILHPWTTVISVCVTKHVYILHGRTKGFKCCNCHNVSSYRTVMYSYRMLWVVIEYICMVRRTLKWISIKEEHLHL